MELPELARLFGEYLMRPFNEMPELSVMAISALLVSLFSYFGVSRHLRRAQRKVTHTAEQARHFTQRLSREHRQLHQQVRQQASRISRKLEQFERLEQHNQGMEVVHEIRLLVLEIRLEVTLLRNRLDYGLNFASDPVREQFKNYRLLLDNYESRYGDQAMRQLFEGNPAPSSQDNAEYQRYLEQLIQTRDNVRRQLETLRQKGNEASRELSRVTHFLETL